MCDYCLAELSNAFIQILLSYIHLILIIILILLFIVLIIILINVGISIIFWWYCI